MADYTQSIDFSAKDALPSGDAAKAAKGADIDTELALIATAIASKVDESREGQALGIATLDAATLVPLSQLPDASTSQQGVVELATTTEAVTGTDTVRAVTPAGIQAVLDQSAGILNDISGLIDPAADRILFWDDSAGTTTFLSVSTGLTLSGTVLTTNDSAIVHDSLSGFVADEHIAHSGVSIIAGSGLTGGGTIAASRTLNVGAGTGISVAADAVALDTTNTRNVDHAAVSITAGDGLTGGGTIAATRDLAMGVGGSVSLVSTNAVTANSHTHALDTAGIVRTEPGTGGQITVSTAAPTGGTAGDMWLQVAS